MQPFRFARRIEWNQFIHVFYFIVWLSFKYIPHSVRWNTYGTILLVSWWFDGSFGWWWIGCELPVRLLCIRFNSKWLTHPKIFMAQPHSWHASYTNDLECTRTLTPARPSMMSDCSICWIHILLLLLIVCVSFALHSVGVRGLSGGNCAILYRGSSSNRRLHYSTIRFICLWSDGGGWYHAFSSRAITTATAQYFGSYSNQLRTHTAYNKYIQLILVRVCIGNKWGYATNSEAHRQARTMALRTYEFKVVPQHQLPNRQPAKDPQFKPSLPVDCCSRFTQIMLPLMVFTEHNEAAVSNRIQSSTHSSSYDATHAVEV